MTFGLESRPETCGCWPREERVAIFNRPGRSALDYRIGTHGSLLRRMLALLPLLDPEDDGQRPLGRLTTRDPDDPAIALLDAWATVGDVLSFYQERIANEGFLRTATERRSVLELARTIGYELNPGVAASTYLAFTVEDRFAVGDQPPPPELGPPIRQAVVPRGTKVLSMPGQGELPQTFETSADLTAQVDWNVLRPRLTVPQPVSLGSTELFVAGIATGLGRGDRILITAPRPDDDNDPQTPPPPGVDTSILEITAVEPDAERDRTRLALAAVPKLPPASQPPAPTPVQPVPDLPFKAPDPPAAPPVAPAEIDPPVFVLRKRPLTAAEIRQRILGVRWPDNFFLAQLRILDWSVDEILRFVRLGRIRLNLEPVEEWVKVVPARDTKRPTVVGVYPENGAKNVHPDTNITVRFSEPMNAANAVAATTLHSGSATGPAVATTKQYVAATGSVVLNPDARLPDQDTNGAPIKYFVVVTPTATDAAGNALAARFESSFEVEDISPPTVDARTPGLDAANVPATTEISITFSEEVTGVSEDSFFLRDAAGTRVPATLSPDSAEAAAKTIKLVPRAPLALSSRYTVTVTSGVADKDNQALSVATEWAFTTALRPADVPSPALAVYAFRERAAFFGHNAPKWATLPQPDPKYQRGEDPYPRSWDDHPRSIWVDSQGSSYGGDTVFLDRGIPDLEPRSWAISESATGAAPYFVANVGEKSLADYGLSGRGAQLTLSQRDGRSPSEGIGNPPNFRVRETEAHVRSEPLKLVELPIEEPLAEGDTEIVLDDLVVGLPAGQPIALRGELLDLPGVIGDEILIVAEAVHLGAYTSLRFRSPLRRSYVRKTVTLTANVVAATHGETVNEILGGGDGSTANQRFALKRPPLTHVSAATASGAESTLEVRVDDVRWDEAPRLYELDARSQRYIVRLDDEAKPHVIFGDGERGARPPTGTENVRATYRTGIGPAGMVGVNRLTLLQTRPLGIQAVTNPLAATGAAAPESRDEARANAPLTIVAMERIVSLRDFEDFARAFAGIGKARAVPLGREDRRFVHLTIAAANGDEIEPTSALYLNLTEAIDAVRDPGPRVVIESYGRRFFNVEAEVVVDARRTVADVLAAVRTALTEAFCFRRREFGQPVTAAEVVTVMQNVDGVVAAYLTKLYEVQEDAPETPPTNPLSQVLAAGRARVVDSGTEPSQLLLVNPGGIVLTERAP